VAVADRTHFSEAMRLILPFLPTQTRQHLLEIPVSALNPSEKQMRDTTKLFSSIKV